MHGLQKKHKNNSHALKNLLNFMVFARVGDWFVKFVHTGLVGTKFGSNTMKMFSTQPCLVLLVKGVKGTELYCRFVDVYSPFS